jgi:hypothetical protein
VILLRFPHQQEMFTLAPFDFHVNLFFLVVVAKAMPQSQCLKQRGGKIQEGRYLVNGFFHAHIPKKWQ